MICFENIAEKDIEEVLAEFSEKAFCSYDELRYKIVYIADSNYVKLEIYDIEKKYLAEEIDNNNLKKRDKYELKFESDGIYLKIDDKNQDANVISEKLVSLEVFTFSYEDIMKAYDKIGELVKISEPSEKMLNPPAITVEFGKESMSASIKIAKAGNWGLLTEELIIEELKKNGVIYGIKNDEIAKIIREEITGMFILVAEGKKCVNGEDAELSMKYTPFSKGAKLTPKIDERGNADFKNLEIFELVKTGDIIAEKRAATLGEQGSTVTGVVVEPKPGKDILLRTGKNCTTSDDGLKVIAETEGMVVIEQDKISVSDIFTIEAVNVNSGNIQFNGSVVVKRDVEMGYSLISNGNIQINGNAEKCILKSGGDIFIKGGLIGKASEGGVTAGNDFVAKFAENAEITVSGNAVIYEGVLNCKVMSGKQVVASGKNGNIIGGEIIAAEGVEASTLGAPSEIKTYIEVGNNPLLVQEIESKESEIASLRQKLTEVEKNINYLEQKRAHADYKPNEIFEEKLNSLIKAKFSMSYYVTEAEIALQEFKQQQSIEKNVEVKVTGTCYPGVLIQIKDRKFKVQDKMPAVTFYYDEDMVKYRY